MDYWVLPYNVYGVTGLPACRSADFPAGFYCATLLGRTAAVAAAAVLYMNNIYNLSTIITFPVQVAPHRLPPGFLHTRFSAGWPS